MMYACDFGKTPHDRNRTMNHSIFDTFRLTVAEQGLGVYGIIVQPDGRPPLEHRFRSDDPECVYSGSKTFTALAVGIAQDENRLSLSDRVIDFFPEYAAIAADGSEAITLRDLLHMASGKPTFWFSCPLEEQHASATDWAERFFREPLVKKPGATFVYSNACTYMLGRVVAKTAGTSLRDYLVPRLFTPLGIHNPQWHTCNLGHTLGASGLHLTTSQYHQLGRLLLGEGLYENRRIVSAGYIRAMHTDTLPTAWPDAESRTYGFQVWHGSRPDTYRADGKYGQFSIVFRDLRLVITATSHCERNANDIIRAVYRDILPRL